MDWNTEEGANQMLCPEWHVRQVKGAFDFRIDFIDFFRSSRKVFLSSICAQCMNGSPSYNDLAASMEVTSPDKNFHLSTDDNSPEIQSGGNRRTPNWCKGCVVSWRYIWSAAVSAALDRVSSNEDS